MTERDREYELSVQALRAEAHPQVDKARVRARLVARGVLASAGAGAATATAAKATASWSAASVGKIVAGLTFLTMLTVAAVHYLAPAPAPRTRTLGHMLEGPLRARSSLAGLRSAGGRKGPCARGSKAREAARGRARAARD